MTSRSSQSIDRPRTAHELVHGDWLAEHDPEGVWGWTSAAGQRRAARRGKMIARHAGLDASARVLEIGCGTGLFTQAFAATGATVVAVDLSEVLLERARARGLPPDRVTFVCRPFEEFEMEAFDALVGSSVLHHLDMSRALERMFVLLKPGGKVSFAEPNMLNPQIAVQKNVPWIKRRLGDSPDETAFVRWQLARRLRDAGFVDVSIRPFDWLHPSTPALLIPTMEFLGRVLERLPVLREFSGSLLITARKPEGGV